MKDYAQMAECGYAAKNEKMADYCVDEISINVNGTNISVPSFADKVFYDDGDGEFKVVLSGISRMPDDSDDSEDSDFSDEASQSEAAPVRVLVYREGVESAVYDKSYEPEYNGDYVGMKVNEILGSPKPGRYEVRIVNATMKTIAIDSASLQTPAAPKPFFSVDGTGCTFRFSILPNGAGMEHGMPKKVAARFDSGDAEILRIDVSLPVDVTSQDVYEVCFVSPSLVPIGFFTVDMTGSRDGMAQVAWNHYWADGAYRCVFVHNGEPFAVSKITIESCKVTEVCAPEPVEPSMMEYLLATCCRSSDELKDMMSVEGCENLKRLCLDVYRATNHNRYREQAKVSDIVFASHFCFFSTGSHCDMEIIRKFAEAAFPLKTVETVDISEVMSPYLTSDPADILKEKLDNSSHFVILTNAGCLMWGNGKRIASVIVQKMRESEVATLALYGNRAEMERLEELTPSLFSRIPSANRVDFGTLDAGSAIYSIEKRLESCQLTLSANARKSIVAGLQRRMLDGTLSSVGIDFAEMFVDKVLMPRFTKRMYADVKGRCCSDKDFLTTVKSADIDWSGIDDMVCSIEKSLAETNAMVGLASVKETVTAIAMKARFDNLRRRQGLPVRSPACHHMIFTGNPGTGKTTIAKKLGKIFRSLGILSRGEVVVAERSTMVGRFIGQTEQNMQTLLEQAYGNVLFIDEAYTLCDTVDDRKDFGYRALECLLTVLSQKSPDMVVIMAGYEKDMDRMLDANQGMRGRFPYRLHFADYTTDELVEIGKRYVVANGLSLTEGAAGKLRDIVEEETASRKRDFSNARWMEQLIDNNVIPVLSERAMVETVTTESVPTMITEEDMVKVKERLPKKKIEKTIGF